MTYYNEEGIIYAALNLLDSLLIKDELSWKIMKNIPLNDRIKELLSIESLSHPLIMACLKILNSLLYNHKDETDIIEDVNTIKIKFLILFNLL